MKNKLYLTLAMGTLMAGCANDEVIDKSQLGNADIDGRIAFLQKIGNMTRASEQAQNAGHYEFGVYGVLGDVADLGAGNTIMSNYLVAYGKNDLYKTIYADNASTAGENASGDKTDVANGLSTWFYEGIGKGTPADGYTNAHTSYNTPDKDQILKYWVKDKAHHFFAYMPYAASANAAYTADQLKLQNLHSFYTDPVVQGSAKVQPTGAVTTAADALAATQYNDEMKNYNEALYAYKQGTYNTDVPLEFKHINSKIQIAFYEEVKGYSVQIIDVRPAGTVTLASSEYAGIAFSTATKAQASTSMHITQPTDLPSYNSMATATVSSMSTTPALAMSGGDACKENLRFQIPTGTIGTTNPTATPSPTIYYAMPQTPTETGLTLHVSYKLHPGDGASDITVYDARCYVAPEYLQWEAGKAYKYIFKITDKSNGVTNPNEKDPATPGEPWVDPEDPRVPDDPALQPIVFDGVKVTDYEDAGDVEGNDHLISNTSIVNAVDWLKSATGGAYTFLSSNVAYNDYNVTLECNYANIAAPNLYVWNDLSRVLGALHQYKSTWVEHIIFDGVQYDWQTTSPTFAGSNWSKTGEPYTGSNEDVRLLRKATTALNSPAAVIKQETVDATHAKVTSRISMNLKFKNDEVVPFTVTVVIPDYPVTTP